ncbi:MAG: 50S ribosomal protein L7 [Oscillospiraceae bacterium]|nr:50S ribosomal protein L7 [Oscillospiraceae bacterium]
MHKALGLLGLARKGGRVALGEEAVSAACRSGHARLMLLAKDAGDSVRHRSDYFMRSGKPPRIELSFTKEEIGTAVGRNVCPIAALTDVSLARAFVLALDEPERFGDLLEQLTRAVTRVEQRRKEEKAHKKNQRYGKK